MSDRQISSIISVTAVYEGASQESTRWLEIAIAIELQSAWQADVIKVCRVKTRSGNITDLFLSKNFHLEAYRWLEIAKAWSLLSEFCRLRLIKQKHGKNCTGRMQ